MFRKKILVVDDSNFFIKAIQSVLLPEGYDVVSAKSGEEGLCLVRQEKPDLVLLDIEMPDMSGFEVCRILRATESNNLMPIVILTGRNRHNDMLTGFDLGADDYIIKPFDNRELIFRVKSILRRIDMNRNANPLTGLPGNVEIQRELDRRIGRNQIFSVIYADLDHFKAYNDVYGFFKGDIAIKLTADILSDASKSSDTGCFIGHVGGDDFIVIIEPDVVDRVCNEIIEAFDLRIRTLYDSEDLKRGHIVTYNRQGHMETFPLMAISLAAVSNKFKTFTSYLEVAEVAAELKKKAKEIKGSSYVKDTREHI